MGYLQLFSSQLWAPRQTTISTGRTAEKDISTDVGHLAERSKSVSKHSTRTVRQTTASTGKMQTRISQLVRGILPRVLKSVSKRSSCTTVGGADSTESALRASSRAATRFTFSPGAVCGTPGNIISKHFQLMCAAFGGQSTFLPVCDEMQE